MRLIKQLYLGSCNINQMAIIIITCTQECSLTGYLPCRCIGLSRGCCRLPCPVCRSCDRLRRRILGNFQPSHHTLPCWRKLFWASAIDRCSSSTYSTHFTQMVRAGPLSGSGKSSSSQRRQHLYSCIILASSFIHSFIQVDHFLLTTLLGFIVLNEEAGNASAKVGSRLREMLLAFFIIF